MKYLLIFSIALMSGVAMQAQSSAIDRYFEKYKSNDKFSQITVSSRMFGLFVNFEMDDPDEQELVKAISKLKGLKMLVGSEMENASSLYAEAVAAPAGEMDELMAIDDADAKFKFYITESNGQISELLMVGYETTQFFILSLVGEIDLKQVAALSRKMDIEGFEHFQNVDE